MTTWLQVRKRIVVNDDPLNRCYDGCFPSSHEEWTQWADVAPYATEGEANAAAQTFKEINPSREYRTRPHET